MSPRTLPLVACLSLLTACGGPEVKNEEGEDVKAMGADMRTPSRPSIEAKVERTGVVEAKVERTGVVEAKVERTTPGGAPVDAVKAPTKGGTEFKVSQDGVIKFKNPSSAADGK